MSSSTSDEPHLLAKSITSMEEATNNITLIVNSNVDRVDSMLGRLEFDLNTSRKEATQLMEIIIADLEILDDFIDGRFQQGIKRKQSMQKMQGEEVIQETQEMPLFEYAPDDRLMGRRDTIHRKYLEYLCNRDGEGQTDLQPTTNLLKEAKENLSIAKDIANNRFNSVFHRLQTLEEIARDDARNHQSKGGRIQRKLRRLQESIKALHKTRSEHSRSEDGKDGIEY